MKFSMKMKKQVFTSVLAVAVVFVSSAKMIDLVTEIPVPEISGTPVPIKLTNLEPLQQTAPVMQVPEGTVNLASGKPVTSSDDWPLIGDLEYITDGDKETGEGYYVELLPELQWVQIDLEASSTIYGIWMWHFHAQRRAYHDVIIQVSDDPAFEDGVTTVYNNDFDNSAGMGTGADLPYIETNFGKLVDAKGVKGQYVRLYSDGNTTNDSNHYIEVEVFGATN